MPYLKKVVLPIVPVGKDFVHFNGRDVFIGSWSFLLKTIKYLDNSLLNFYENPMVTSVYACQNYFLLTNFLLFQRWLYLFFPLSQHTVELAVQNSVLRFSLDQLIIHQTNVIVYYLVIQPASHRQCFEIFEGNGKWLQIVNVLDFFVFVKAILEVLVDPSVHFVSNVWVIHQLLWVLGVSDSHNIPFIVKGVIANLAMNLPNILLNTFDFVKPVPVFAFEYL